MKTKTMTPALPGNAKWSAALYIRLSREDAAQGESNSVASQREILKEYLKQRDDVELYDFYVDEGWTGTNFDRPDFKRMMRDVTDKKVNCVIVKDLSRLGRNYAQSSELITNEFSRLGVRLISLNNGIDSASDNMNAATRCITIGVTGVINESVAATTSVNVRATLNINRRRGDFIGSFAPFGYAKDPADHHKLVIDENAAPTVRLIYERFIGGESIIGIAKTLNAMGVPNPSAYKKQMGLNCSHPAADGLWQESSVRRILQNEVYVGNMVQGKRRNISYLKQKPQSVPEEEWFRVDGTHEPIVSRDTFDKAQSLFNRGIRKSPKENGVGIFAGVVRCGHCRRAMSVKTNVHPYGTYRYYRCVTAQKMSETACVRHSVRIDKLEEAVLLYLRTMSKTLIDLDKLLKKISEDPRHTSQYGFIMSKLDEKKKEREALLRNKTDLYLDVKNGLVAEEDYPIMRDDLTERIKRVDEAVAALEKSAAEEKAKSAGTADTFPLIGRFAKYGLFEKLTREMVVEFIDEIRIFEGGNIEIDVKFRDEFDELVGYIERNTGAA